MPSKPYTGSGMDPSRDLYGTGTMAGMNVGMPGPNTGGLTARARSDQPALGPPAGPKPNKPAPPSPGATQPTQNMPDIGVTNDSDGDQGETQFEDVGDAIGSFVQQQFSRMKNDRIYTDYLLLRCLYARKGEYSPEELQAMGGNSQASTETAAKTYFPITGTKCRAGEAWIADIFAGTEGRLWSISPTPIPNVPDFIREMVIQQIKTEIQQQGGQIDEQEIRARVKELRDIAMAHVQDAAAQAADRMSQKIQDQLDDTNFDAVLDEFVSDVLTFPYAVVKGPVIRNQQMMEWQGSTPVVKTKATLRVERVSPFDYYYSQYATNPQEGNIIELMHMTRASLHNCIGLDNFNDQKIRQVLESYPTGYKVYTQITTQRQQLERNTLMNINANELIDTFDFWGAIQGTLLRDWGMKEIKDLDAMYEVNAWVVNGICMRAVLNPDPMKKRPYYVTSYEKVPGALVGRSVPVLMRSNAEIINSAYRALRRNMGLASGPFAEVDISRLGGAQAPEEIRPAMVKAVEPDLTGGSNPAYKFHNINSHAQELEAVIDAEIKKCDDVTGIPAYSYGNAAVAGAGRTVGGLAMLMGNASKGIKKVIGNIESDILDPLIQAYYNYNMLYDEDESIKVDAQIVARGPTGVILKEAQVQRRVEALQVLGPYIPTGIIQKDGLAHLLRQILNGLDLDVDKIIPSPEQQQQLQAIAGQPPGMPGQPQQPPGAPPGVSPSGPPGSPPSPAPAPPLANAARGPGGPPNVTALFGGPPAPPGQVSQLPYSAPRRGPPPPLGGTVPQVRPDGRSRPAASVVAAMNRGRV